MALTSPKPSSTCWLQETLSPNQVLLCNTRISKLVLTFVFVKMLTWHIFLSLRSGYAAGQWSVRGSWQAQLHSLFVPLPVRAQRSGLCQDEDHSSEKAVTRVLGLHVSRAHSRWSAMRPDESPHSPLWDCGSCLPHYDTPCPALLTR